VSDGQFCGDITVFAILTAGSRSDDQEYFITQKDLSLLPRPTQPFPAGARDIVTAPITSLRRSDDVTRRSIPLPNYLLTAAIRRHKLTSNFHIRPTSLPSVNEIMPTNTPPLLNLFWRHFEPPYKPPPLLLAAPRVLLLLMLLLLLRRIR
jgi:hypothetical protein